ncbi:MAG TPA: alpha-amylase family glycosyl hydrolase [Candidatus Limnocylindrales bacterium]|nr:alpha-amylase family glycosyl hydrolase [Candidatus Limnocylindrales bacterium]
MAAADADGPRRPWWEPAVLYQIYPRSFQDSDGDGVGDLRGITSRLDYLAWLGIDALWLSPIFRSPMRDFGYDISDYRDVDPVFGTLEDLDELIAQAHARGLRVLLDYVPNHTSSDHPWFVDSRSSRGNPKRDWYVWRDPAPDGGPPNDWRAVFGGGEWSAWELDPRTGQYYLHLFLPEQPDLNWANPDVRREMHDVLRFWFRRGVDGFRIDVINLLSKDPELRDEEPNPAWRPGDRPTDRFLWHRRSDGPQMPAILAGLRAVAEEFGDRLLVGETYMPLERLVAYYGGELPGIHLPFNFQLILLPWDARAIGDWIARYEAALPVGAWPNWVLGNHDQPRVASRVGPAQARVAAMLLLTLRGTPTLFAGDEIGRENVPIPPERVVDVDGRDPERAPMPWSAGPGGGFTTGEPWLPLGDAEGVNVEAQRDDPRSMLTLHRRLLAMRRAEPALAVGSWIPGPGDDAVLSYGREAEGRRLEVALNLGHQPRSVELVPGRWRVALSTHLDRGGEVLEGRADLRADEGVILEPA